MTRQAMTSITRYLQLTIIIMVGEDFHNLMIQNRALIIAIALYKLGILYH